MERLSATLNKNKALKMEDAVEDNDLHKVRTVVSPDGADTDAEVEVAAWDLDGKKHPLKTPVILQHLFKLCPASTLASCRRVCKLWYDESLVTWRTKVPLQVKANGANIVLGRNMIPFHKFLEFVIEPGSGCSSKPYRNVRLGIFMDWRGTFNPVHEMFWRIMGSSLTTLQFDTYKFEDVEEFRRIIFKCCPNLINLTIKFPLMFRRSRDDQNCLEYKRPAYGEHKNLRFLRLELFSGGHLPVSWIELFSHFSSITFFILDYRSNHPYPHLDELMDAIRIIRKQDKQKLPFKYFDYCPTLSLINSSTFVAIRELHLPLRKFNIAVNANIDESILIDTLNSLRESVRCINLVNPEKNEGPDQLPIPSLLIKNFPFGIQLDGLRHIWMEDDFCESLSFLKYTPNLASLHIHGSENNYYNKSTTTIVSNTSINVKMKSLVTFLLDFIVSEDDLQRLFNWMPDIRNLKMVLNDKQFGMVCQNWRNLKQLEVFGQELTNEGVAGIKEGKGARKADLVPNISKLSSLETFHYDTSKLTVDGVLHAFLQLPSLRILQRWGFLSKYSGSDVRCRMEAQDAVTDLWRSQKIGLEIDCAKSGDRLKTERNWIGRKLYS